jgi:hypothetical protein
MSLSAQYLIPHNIINLCGIASFKSVLLHHLSVQLCVVVIFQTTLLVWYCIFQMQSTKYAVVCCCVCFNRFRFKRGDKSQSRGGDGGLNGSRNSGWGESVGVNRASPEGQNSANSNTRGNIDNNTNTNTDNS